LNFWIGSAIIFVVFENQLFYFQLKKWDVAVNFFWAATPGYLDYIYIKWCKENSNNYIPRIFLRLIVWTNLILALISSG